MKMERTKSPTKAFSRQRLSWLQNQAMGWLQGLVLRVRARMTRRRFTCEALGGRSSYNICINSDLTVSCNCQDYDGAGQIGNLREQSLEQIMRGEKSGRFRRALAAGRLPISTCSRCIELRLVDREEAFRLESSVDVPRKGLMVENTVLCNLSCTACAREQVLKTREQKQWREGDAERIAKTVAEYGIKHVTFFNLGEPFFSRDVLQEIGAIRYRNPQTRIMVSTNGSMLEGKEKHEAAFLLDHIMFSLDGDCQETAEKYQIGIDFDRAYSNMAALVAERRERGALIPTIEWKYVVFRWNDRPAQIRRAIQLAREAGVDRISFWPAIIPLHGVSWRYRVSPFFKTLGTKSRQCRLIDLRALPASAP